MHTARHLRGLRPPPGRLCARRTLFFRHCTGVAFCFRRAYLGPVTCLCRGLPLLLHTARHLRGLRPPPGRLCARRTLFLRHCTGGAFRLRRARPGPVTCLCRGLPLLHTARHLGGLCLPSCGLCARRTLFFRHCTGGAFRLRRACLGPVTCLCRGLPLLLHTARHLRGLRPPPGRLCARRTLFLRHCTGGAFRLRRARPGPVTCLCRGLLHLCRIFRDGRGGPRLPVLRRRGAGRAVCVHAASPFFCGGRGMCRAAPPVMYLSVLPSSYHLRSHNKNTIILYSY